jgi:hypothetical protein
MGEAHEDRGAAGKEPRAKREGEAPQVKKLEAVVGRPRILRAGAAGKDSFPARRRTREIGGVADKNLSSKARRSRRLESLAVRIHRRANQNGRRRWQR